MKKIMLISPKDNNFYNFRSELILKLKKEGFEVVLVCPYGKKINFFIERGCKFIDIDIDRRGTSIFNDLELMNKYTKVLKKEKPDVVLTYTTKCSIYGGIVCRFLSIPYIVNNAGLIETNNKVFGLFLKILYKLGFSGASCIMYQNKKERDVINQIVSNKVKYRDIPGSGVNLDEFTYEKYPENDDVIIFNYVARIVSIKGIEEFLDCAEIINSKYKNTRFIIYGDYDEERYRIRINDLEKKGIIKYGGVQMDMKPYIKIAHAVIHPSYYEGMTNVVLEHSAMGRVCIGSNIPGVSDGIDDEKTGFLFEVKNVESMVQCVEKFIELSHEKKVLMGKNARDKMEKEFDRNIVTNIYINEIKKVIK